MTTREYKGRQEVLDECRDSWNTGTVGEERAQRVNEVISRVCREYGAAFDMSPLDVYDAIEGSRDYSAINFYQDAKFPSLENVMIFDEVAEVTALGVDGWRCPRCQEVSSNPQVCDSHAEMAPGEICDWKAYGFMGTLGQGIQVLVREQFPDVCKPVHLFKPVSLE